MVYSSKATGIKITWPEYLDYDIGKLSLYAQEESDHLFGG